MTPKDRKFQTCSAPFAVSHHLAHGVLSHKIWPCHAFSEFSIQLHYDMFRAAETRTPLRLFLFCTSYDFHFLRVFIVVMRIQMAKKSADVHTDGRRVNLTLRSFAGKFSFTVFQEQVKDFSKALNNTDTWTGLFFLMMDATQPPSENRDRSLTVSEPSSSPPEQVIDPRSSVKVLFRPSDSIRNESDTNCTLCFIKQGDQTVAEFVKHHVEHVSPTLWLSRICQHANSSGVDTGVVKVCYGDGYETIVLIGDVDVNPVDTNQAITVGMSLETSDAFEGSSALYSELIWTIASSGIDANAEYKCLYIRMDDPPCQQHVVPLDESMAKLQVVRFWPNQLNGNDLELPVSSPHRATPTPIPARLTLLPSQLTPSYRYDLSSNNSSLCSIGYSEQTVAEFLKYQVEEASPEFWLRRIFNYITSSDSSGVCRICYGNGYVTQVMLMNANANSSKSGPIVTVGLSLDPSDTSDEYWEWTRGAEPLWDFVSSETNENIVSNVFLMMGTRRCQKPPGMNDQEIKTRFRKIRLLDLGSDLVFYDIFPMARSQPRATRPRATRPLIPSHQVVKDFVDNRPDSERLDGVMGRERLNLKRRVFSHLRNAQQDRFANNDIMFDKWLSDVLRSVRGHTIQPVMTRNGRVRFQSE